jgi:hypothetical protein
VRSEVITSVRVMMMICFGAVHTSADANVSEEHSVSIFRAPTGECTHCTCMYRTEMWFKLSDFTSNVRSVAMFLILTQSNFMGLHTAFHKLNCNRS